MCRAAGWVGTISDPRFVVASQHPDAHTPEELPVGTLMVTEQLGNLYLLMAFIGVAVLYSTSEPKVVRNYFVALALGDVGHLYMTYLGLGQANFVNVTQWNAMAWGNIGFTAFLLLNRVVYLLGLFGSARLPHFDKKSQ